MPNAWSEGLKVDSCHALLSGMIYPGLQVHAPRSTDIFNSCDNCKLLYHYLKYAIVIGPTHVT